MVPQDFWLGSKNELSKIRLGSKRLKKLVFVSTRSRGIPEIFVSKISRKLSEITQNLRKILRRTLV